MITLEGGTTLVQFRRSARARRISLRVDPAGGGVVVTLPMRASRHQGMALVKRHVDWIATRIAALPRTIPFVDGAEIPLYGTPHRIRHSPLARGAAWIADGDLHVTGAAEFLARRVRDFLRAEARRSMLALVAAKSATIGIAPKRVTIKDTTSRWGSCAPDRSLAFSWRLVMAPASVQDYVAAHEVAHMRHMNHGPEFWALVDTLTPHKMAALAWLHANGQALFRVG